MMSLEYPTTYPEGTWIAITSRGWRFEWVLYCGQWRTWYEAIGLQMQAAAQLGGQEDTDATP